MKQRKTTHALAAAALGAFAALPATAAFADTASDIRALKAQLKQLEAKVAEQHRQAASPAANVATHAAPRGEHAHAGAAPLPAPKHWYERISLRGYTQMRYNDIISGGPIYNDISSPVDRSIGPRQNFLIRRMRMIFYGDISDHLSIYIQPDFASAPGGAFTNAVTTTGVNVNPMTGVPLNLTNAIYGTFVNQIGTYSANTGYFTQLRDAYADIYFDKDKEFRVRAGQSKIPYGFENMQSSQNRLALDRADAINSCCRDERDLGLYFYYTPKHLRPVFKDLVKNNLKGSGDYGMFAFGVYNGQGANRIELNRNTHLVARLTYPYVFENGQIVEASIQGYTGRFVPYTSAITPGLFGATFLAGFRPAGFFANGVPFVNAPGYSNLGNYRLGTYPLATAWAPFAVNGGQGLKDERVAVTGVLYPQPFGLKAEWNWGRGPVLDPTQTVINSGRLQGGYVEATYKHEDKEFGTGTWFPFVKWQHFNGGQKFETNAPRSRLFELDVGVEYQPLPELEFSLIYSKMNRTNVLQAPYRQFHANLMRMQLQWNY